VPLFALGQMDNKNYAGATADILNPDKLFKALKENITITLPTSDKPLEITTPQKALEEASPKLQEVSKDVKDETGIDFAKFLRWTAKILKLFFQTVVDILEMVAKALEPNPPQN